MVGRSPASSTPSEIGTDWLSAWVAVACGVLIAFQVGKVAVALPVLRSEVSISLAAASWMIAAFGIAGATIGLAVGMVVRRLGARTVAASGLVVAAFGSVTAALANDGNGLLAARGIEAIGAVGTSVALPSLIGAAAARRDQWLAFGAWGAQMPLGQAVVIGLAPLVLVQVGWRALWDVNGLLLLLGAITLAVVTRRTAAPREPGGIVQSITEMRALFGAPAPRALAAIFLAYSFQWTTVVGFLPTVYVDSGMALAPSAILTALVVAVNVVGNLLGSALTRLGWRRGTLTACACLAMATCDVAIFTKSVPFPLTYAAALVFSGIGGFIPANLFAGVALLARSRGEGAGANGLLLQGSWIGSAAGPVVVGAIAVATGGWSSASWILAPAGLCGAFVALANKWEANS